MPGEVAPEQAQRRLEALQELQRSQTLAYHQSRVGDETLVLIDGRSRRGGLQLAGRDLHNRVVNLDLAPDHAIEPGARLAVRIVEATPHSLLAEPLDPALRPNAASGDSSATP